MIAVRGFSTPLPNLTPDEKQHLGQLFGIQRLIWNLCLGYKKELWETYKRRNPCVDNLEELNNVYELGNSATIQKQLSKKRIRELIEYDFLLICPAKAVQQCVRKLDRAFINFFQGKGGYPRFKKKSDLNSIQFDSFGKIEKKNRKFFKITTNKLSFVCKNPIKDNKIVFNSNTKICSITLSKNTNNQYFVSINYSYEEKTILKVKKIKTVIGIDRGVTTTATCSNEKEFNIDKNKINHLNSRIKRLKKQMSKKIKGSSNREKIKLKIAKIYNKKTNIKIDFNHKLSNYLVKNHDLIVMENLNIKNMTKSAKGTIDKPGTKVSQKSGLNRSILENNWGQLRQFVEYKANIYGKHITLINPQYTSQKCSNCGHTEKDNRKGKLFYCLKCNYNIDSDLNASINIRTAGLAGFACRGFSLEKSLKQELEKKLKIS